MIIVVENEHSDLGSNLDESVCVSHSTNSLGKEMILTILPLKSSHCFYQYQMFHLRMREHVSQPRKILLSIQVVKVELLK